MKLPSINWKNWRMWLQNCGFVLGGFIAGGLTVANWAPPKQLVIAAKEVKTTPVDTRAAVACTASLAELQNLRSDFKQVCGAKAQAKSVQGSVAK